METGVVSVVIDTFSMETFGALPVNSYLWKHNDKTEGKIQAVQEMAAPALSGCSAVRGDARV